MTRHPPDRQPSPAAAPAGAAPLQAVDVRVRMFGMVSAITGEREVTLPLPANAAVADVVAALGERYGAVFTDEVMRAAGRKASHCRIVVDGRLVRDITAPLGAAGDSPIVEIILLTAYEGG